MKTFLLFLFSLNLYSLEIKHQEREYLFISLIKKSQKNISKQPTLKYAKSFLNTPYLWGGESISGIDCSSFTQQVYEYHGIYLPRTSRTQYQDKQLKSINIIDLEPLDLLFFRKNNKNISHVGIYLGHNRFIHAAKKNKKVQIDKLFGNTYWNKIFFSAKRIKE